MALDSDKAVFNSALITLSSTVAASALPTKYGGKGELPRPRLLVGTGLTFLGLSILGDIAPGFAGPLSAAIALTALTYYGIPIADNYFKGTDTNPVGRPPTKIKEQ